MKRISIQTDDFDTSAECAALEAAGVGAVSTFTGIVRGDGGISAMTLEHYPGMTEAALDGLAEQALARWPLAAVRIIHRVGRLEVGARIVFVGAASAHRRAALEACAFLIDQLKTSAPFWKKEHGKAGDHWVDARESDDVAAARWA
jgi:molybdopterin synthase catalytic subunit